MKLVYRELTQDDYKNIVEVFGQDVVKYDLVQFKKHTLNVGVFDAGKIIGIVTVYATSLIPPLECKSAFIGFIEVLETYRRQGIATKLVTLAEDWAKKQGLFQIMAWSSQDKNEMIYLAKKLGYGLTPAIMYDKHYLPKTIEDIVVGYYYAKRLD